MTIAALALGPEERTLADTAPTESALGGYTFAHEITPQVDGVLTHFRYWHQGTHEAGCTHPLRLFRDGLMVAELVDHPPAGPAGWREAPFAEPFAVVPLAAYRVAYYATQTQSVASSSPPPASSMAPNVALTSGSFYGALESYPATAQAINRHIDVVYRSGTPDVEPAPDDGERAAIVAALAGIAGIDPVPYRPDVASAGAAWPVSRITDYEPTMACLMATPRWEVIACVPGGTIPDKGDAVDALAPAIADALYLAGIVPERHEIIELQVSVGATDTIPALRFTLAA